MEHNFYGADDIQMAFFRLGQVSYLELGWVPQSLFWGNCTDFWNIIFTGQMIFGWHFDDYDWNDECSVLTGGRYSCRVCVQQLRQCYTESCNGCGVLRQDILCVQGMWTMHLDHPPLCRSLVGLWIFRKFNISGNFPKISGNISKSLEVIMSIIFIRIWWYPWQLS